MADLLLTAISCFFLGVALAGLLHHFLLIAAHKDLREAERDRREAERDRRAAEEKLRADEQRGWMA